jgi:hypothetical protein
VAGVRLNNNTARPTKRTKISVLENWLAKLMLRKTVEFLQQKKIAKMRRIHSGMAKLWLE